MPRGGVRCTIFQRNALLRWRFYKASVTSRSAARFLSRSAARFLAAQRASERIALCIFYNKMGLIVLFILCFIWSPPLLFVSFFLSPDLGD